MDATTRFDSQRVGALPVIVAYNRRCHALEKTTLFFPLQDLKKPVK